MARSGTLGGGSLSPFGGATTDFGAFDIAKTVDSQESANLAFAVSREQHDAGLMTDADFAAIQANYLNGLDKTTVSGATAQYTIQMTQYTNERNALAQAVQTGQVDAQQLVAYDQNALAQTVPGSAEYMQRQDRLWTSQGMVFQQSEVQVLDNLKDGRITNLQAQEWYKEQAVMFPDNFQIQSDIKAKVTEFADRIVAEADKAMADSWNKGNMTIAQVIAYTAQAAADDPGGSRAKELTQFAYDARLQAQESSMKYRYDLTREYAQLAKLVAQSAPSSGGTSTSTSTRTFWNGTKWVTQTSTSTKQNAPSASMIAANAQRLKDIATAKERMAQIKTTVGNIAGGWVSDQDYIRNLTSQQSSQAKGSPGWYALQQQIDGYQQRIAQDKMDATLGLKVAYPRVSSEMTADLSAGLGGEVPVGTGLSNAQLRQVQGWNAAITKLQESVATGMLTEEQLAQANSDIAKNKAYVAGMLKSVAAPKVTVAPVTKAGTSGGTSGGTVAARTGGSATSIGTAKTNGGAFVAAGPLQKVVSQSVSVVPIEGTLGRTGAGGFTESRFVKTTPTGLPVGMSPSAFDDFHTSLVAAVKAGQASFVDKTTGAVYAIPLDPDERLAMLRYVDDTNVDLKVANLKAALANPKASDTYIDGKRASVSTAQNTATANILWVLNTSNAGNVYDSNGKAIKLGVAPTAGKVSNSLAFGLDLLDVTANHAQQHYDLAQTYFDKGDYTAAAAEINAGRQIIASVTQGPNGTAQGSLLAKYAAQASSVVEQVASVGGKVDSTILTDLKRLNNFGVELQEPSKSIDKTATALFGAPGKIGTGILVIVNGMVVPDSLSGAALLRDGYVRLIGEDGSVTAKQVKATGSENGKPTYTLPGRVMVMVNLGGKQETMSAAFEVGQVGEMLIDGLPVAISGKIVTIGSDVWMESPFRPGLWVPMNGASTTRFTAPTGAKSGVNPPGKDNIPGLAAGAAYIEFTKNGTQYILSPNALGGMDLYENTINGAALIGSGGTSAGTPDQNYQRIVGDFTYDSTTLSAEQRGIVNLVTSGVSKTGGAWVGSNAQEIADYMKRSFPSPINAATGFDTTKTQPLPPAYAPPTVQVTTPSGGTRVVSTGQLPAATGGAYMYEGAGGTYIPTKITAPPASGVKVSPISTVVSATGVKKTVSTGKVATPVSKPAVYETNPLPVKPAPTTTVSPSTGFTIKAPYSGPLGR